MKNRVVFILILIMILLSSISCDNQANGEYVEFVGIFLPCTSSERWLIEGKEMSSILEDKGYDVELFYANQDSALQKKQIEDAIEFGLDAMIIAAVNPIDLVKVLDTAANNEIEIIAYDRILIDTYAVSYFVGFDSTLIGIQQGSSLIEGLRANGDGPYNIEIFAGCSKNDNARHFYDGAMSVIEPLIESGEINIFSKEISFEDVSREECYSNTTGERMNRLLSTYYSNDVVLHGILSTNDSISTQLIDILDNNSYYYPNTFPVITGQDAEINNLIAVTNSKQYSTIFKNSMLLAQIAASMVTAVLNDKIPEVNDVTSFYNGVKIVPSYLCEPVLITKDNYERILIDRGYIRYEDVFPDG